MPPLVRSRTAWACGSSAAHAGQVPGSSVSAGIAASISAAAACRHWPASSAGIWSAVTAWTSRCTDTDPSPGGADQRIPAQRRDRIPGRQLVLQQRHQHRRHVLAEPPGEARAGLQQQPQRDRLGRQNASSRSSPAAPGAGLRQVRRTPAARWWPPSGGTRSARRGPAGPGAAAGTRPGTRPGCPRWPGRRRRPAPAPAAARPALRPAPGRPAGPGHRCGRPGTPPPPRCPAPAPPGPGRAARSGSGW